MIAGGIVIYLVGWLAILPVPKSEAKGQRAEREVSCRKNSIRCRTVGFDVVFHAMRLLKIAAASLVFLGCSLPVTAAPVVNHSFETGDYTGWTQFGNTSFSPVIGPAFGTFFPTDGSFQASFGPQGSTGGITQDIVTTPGTTYEIVFDLFNFGGSPVSSRSISAG